MSCAKRSSLTGAASSCGCKAHAHTQETDSQSGVASALTVRQSAGHSLKLCAETVPGKELGGK